MSILIEMGEISQELQIEDRPPENLKQMIKSVLRSPEFELEHLSQNITHLIFSTRKSPTTFPTALKWDVNIHRQGFRLVVLMLDRTGINYLRAKNDRMKIELIIMLRLINERLPIEEQFILEPDSGLLKYTFSIYWKDFKAKIPRLQALKKFFKYLLLQLNTYAQVIFFCDPGNQLHYNAQEKAYLYDQHIALINQYRFMLQNTKNMRQKGITYMGKIIQLKEISTKAAVEEHANIKMQLDHVRYLFQSNIHQLHQMSLGLGDKQQEIKCAKRIELNSRGYQNHQGSQEGREKDSYHSKKIVNGIIINEQKKVEKLISKEGAHSQIYRSQFSYTIVESINQETIQNSRQNWALGKQETGQFAYKKCNPNSEGSKNSFMNEIYFLNHVKDAQSNYIGKYFLEVKRFGKRTEKDCIYMKPYIQSLDYIIRKAYSLSYRERLQIVYKISKGLCFLSARGILHRDIKQHNIVLDSGMNPFIIDFGSCAPMCNQVAFKSYDTRLLTTKYMHIHYHELPIQYSYIQKKISREQYERHPLFDVYSFGRVISFVFFNSLHPPNCQQLQAYSSKDLLKNILFLISMCLSIDPDDRPSFGQIASFIGALSKFTSTFESYIMSKAKDPLKRTLSETKQQVEKNK